MQTYDIKPLSQHFEKKICQYVNISIANFLRAPIFEEHLRTAASGDVFMKLIKINIYS